MRWELDLLRWWTMIIGQPLAGYETSVRQYASWSQTQSVLVDLVRMRLIHGRMPTRQRHCSIKTAFLQTQAQIARQRRIAIGQIGEGEFSQAHDMADMGMAVIGECEGQLDQMRRTDTKAQNILVEDGIVQLARPDPVGIVEKCGCRQ